MKYISNGHKESYTLVARKRYMKKLLYVSKYFILFQNVGVEIPISCGFHSSFTVYVLATYTVNSQDHCET